MNAVTDEQLIRWVADGDPSCLATLFERHHRGVYRYCRQVLRDRTLCEDMTQDVFLKVLKQAKKFRGDGSFKAWLFTIARNEARDALRRRKGQPARLDDEARPDVEPADPRSAEQSAAGRQGIAQALAALATLPVTAQETIWLGRFEFDNYEELGRALDCSAGTARVRMHRALAQLNAAWTRLYGDPADA